MQPDRQLIDALERDRVERARAMSPEDKLMAGPRLFEQACRAMADGIRDEHPEATEAEVQELLGAHLALLRQQEEQGIYFSAKQR